MKKLSVIIPTFNEEKNPFFQQTLKIFSDFLDIELIVSDGGSTDKTLELCAQFEIKVVRQKTASRALRINRGIAESTAEFILLHHPRSLISRDGIEFLLQNTTDLSWGGFSHSFDILHPLLQLTSWYSNYIRGGLSGIIYLDHCIFFKRPKALNLIQLPAVDIFEDTILSKKLLKIFGRPIILPYKVTTSALRFKTNGVLKQSLINQYLKINFFLGADHGKMNRLYEKKTGLNSEYNDNK